MEKLNDSFGSTDNAEGHTRIPHWLFHCLLLVESIKET